MVRHGALLAAMALCALARAQDAAPVPDNRPEPAASEAAAQRLREDSERAADRGLQWLADRQLACGGWAALVGHKMMDDYVVLDQALSVEEQVARGHAHLGVTAIAGMAFLAGGHLPDRGTHRESIRKAIDYVVGCSRDNGFLTDSGTRMYSHAFATLFLAEVYGMAGSEPVQAALEKAVNLIVDCQNQQGGWRYNPFDREADLSVTVCQLQALRAARNIGIKVPEGTVDRAVAYVQRSRTRSGRNAGLFYYKIQGRGAYEKNREFAINAAGVTALNSAGIHDPALSDPALEFLLRAYGEVAEGYGTHYYFWYGNYYACQALFQDGGPRFARYHERLSRDILAGQQADGRWRNDCGPGDAFGTAMACILLQQPRQYLPIFQR